MAGRLTAVLLSSVAAVATVAAAPRQDEMDNLTAAFDAVLTGMAYLGAGLCFFAIVWAGFLLMAEGAEGENRGKARTAVFMAVSAWWWCCWPRASPPASSTGSSRSCPKSRTRKEF